MYSNKTGTTAKQQPFYLSPSLSPHTSVIAHSPFHKPVYQLVPRFSSRTTNCVSHQSPTMRAFEQVQVQLRIPLTSQPPEQHCSSSTAHESLRRFAQGYVFGASSRIGPSEPLSDKQKGHDSSRSTCNFKCNDPTDFASRAVKTDKHARETACSRNRPEGKRSALVFGENAPKVTLPVKERIERKTVPKRCRGTVSMDALSAMMESLLASSESKTGTKSREGDEKLTRTFGELKLRRRPNERAVKGKTGKVAKAAKAEKGNENEREQEKRAGDQIAQLEKDDVADELSFLVKRCDLDSDKKEATFMPYIT